MTQKIDQLVKWVANFDLSQLEKTEDDVETKFIIPLFQDYLDYPVACRRGKYPIPNYSPEKRGRKPEIDHMFFSSEDDTKHGPETGLILIEAKRQGESLEEAIEQAKFYSYYLKPIIYVVIDGIKILTYKRDRFRSDELVFEGEIKELRNKDVAKKLYEYLNYTAANHLKNTLTNEVTHNQYILLSRSINEHPDFQDILKQGDFEPEELLFDKSIIKVTQKVAIECELPEPSNEGHCVIEFSDPMLHGLKIYLSHEEIIENLLLGLDTPPHNNNRKFIQKIDDVYEAQLGQTILALNETVAVNLCECIDFIGSRYRTALIDAEERLKTWAFARVNIRGKKRGVRLISVSPWLWKLMHKFTLEFDYGKGRSDWHIFSAKLSHIIHVSRGITHHVQLHALPPENPLTSQELNVIYLPVTDYLDESNWSQKVGVHGIWTAEYTRVWLLREFIPKVYSHYQTPKLVKNPADFFRRKILQDSPLKTFPNSDFFKANITDWKAPYLPLTEVTNPKDLMNFLYDIQESAHCYPVRLISSRLLKDYYASFAALASHIHFDFSEDYYIAGNLLAIDADLARCNLPFFHVSGFEQVRDFTEGIKLFDRQTILECLRWHAQRITNSEFERNLAADLLSRVYLHILAQGSRNAVTQEILNKAIESLLPLWEYSRFENRYIIL